MMPALCAVIPMACAAISAAGAELPAIPGLTLTELRVPSSVDGAEQPIVVGVPDAYDGTEPTPLLVGLHTW